MPRLYGENSDAYVNEYPSLRVPWRPVWMDGWKEVDNDVSRDREKNRTGKDGEEKQ